jgi:hypothetical protein
MARYSRYSPPSEIARILEKLVRNSATEQERIFNKIEKLQDEVQHWQRVARAYDNATTDLDPGLIKKYLLLTDDQLDKLLEYDESIDQETRADLITWLENLYSKWW